MRRAPVVLIVLIGLGLVLAPVAFRMFERAPKGGEMIDDFRPLMTTERLDTFAAHLDTIGDAHAEVAEAPARMAGAGADPSGFEDRFALLADFERRWPDVDEDMSGMLATIRANLERFHAVDALPPFPLFPWFFVAPGLLLALAAGRALQRRRLTLLAWAFLLAVGLGLVAAPAVFQMFSRAPQGAAMIDDFRPLMTPERITEIQGYFVTLAGAEGDLRTGVAPAVAEADASFAEIFPDAAVFVDGWPQIARDLAPMVGAMADNLDNYAAVDALPPFWLFPWFFVIPGVLVVVLAVMASRQSRRASRPRPDETRRSIDATT